MIVAIKVQKAEHSDLGLAEAFTWTELEFRNEKLDSFFIAENEIVFAVNGNEYSTTYNGVLAKEFATILRRK